MGHHSDRGSQYTSVAFGARCEALEEALARFGEPEIFNTDQGSQFTSAAFTDVLKRHEIKISMDGRGRWMDNVFVERLDSRTMRAAANHFHFQSTDEFSP